MSKVQRKEVSNYNIGKHNVRMTAMQPDLLVYVDGSELPAFYVNREAGDRGARRYIEHLRKVNEE